MGLTPEDLGKMLVFAAEAAFLPERGKAEAFTRVIKALSKTHPAQARMLLTFRLSMVF